MTYDTWKTATPPQFEESDYCIKCYTEDSAEFYDHEGDKICHECRERMLDALEEFTDDNQ